MADHRSGAIAEVLSPADRYPVGQGGASKPAWAKQGEHLSALPAIKRLWPTLFAEEVGKALAAGERGEQETIGRFVVSTHTMALARQLDQWLARGGLTSPGFKQASSQADPVAVPRG